MRAVLKPAVFAASLVPFLFDVVAVATNRLGPHPYRIIIQDSGEWTLWFLAFTVVLTPLRRVTSAHWLVRYRRMLGLFSFFYAAVHTLTYVVFDRLAVVDASGGGDMTSVVGALVVSTARDVWDKPFLAIGVLAFALMVPLAVTSTSAMIRVIGGANWRRLHRLVYVVAIASLLHHWWPLGDRFHADRYGLLIGAALAARLAWFARRRTHMRAAVERLGDARHPLTALRR